MRKPFFRLRRTIERAMLQAARAVYDWVLLNYHPGVSRVGREYVECLLRHSRRIAASCGIDLGQYVPVVVKYADHELYDLGFLPRQYRDRLLAHDVHFYSGDSRRLVGYTDTCHLINGTWSRYPA